MQTLQTPRLRIRQFSMDDLEVAHQIIDLEMQWDGADVSLQQQSRTSSTTSSWPIGTTGAVYSVIAEYSLR